MVDTDQYLNVGLLSRCAPTDLAETAYQVLQLHQFVDDVILNATLSSKSDQIETLETLGRSRD